MSATWSAVPRARLAARPLAWPAALDVWLLIAVGLLLFSAGLGLRDPWPADEPRFALIARDMVRSGQWLFPHVGGELYSDKPPFFIWLSAGLYAATGELRIAFLLPSLLAGLGTVVLVHDLARRLWNRRVALVAGLLLLGSVQFTLQARSAQLDALVTFWTTLGLYGLARHLLLGPDWRWYAAAGVAMGLGVITKGVGFLPVFVLLPWAWLMWRRPQALPGMQGGWRWALLPAGLLLPIVAWLVPLLVAAGLSGDPALAAYRDDLLFRQTATRYADSWGHVQPAWFYLLEVIPWAWLPATLALPWLLPAWRRRLARADARYWLLLGYLACVLVFFSLSPGKRHVYLLPALPAFVLASAPLLAAGLLRRAALRGAALVTVLLIAVAAVGVATLLAGNVGGLADRAAREGFAATELAAVLGIFALGAAGLLAWGRARRQEPLALALVLMWLWLPLGWLGHPAMNDARSGKDLMAQVAVLAPPGQALAVMGWKEQLLLHLDRPIVHFGCRRRPEDELLDAAAWLEATPGGQLLVAEHQAAPCLDPARARPVAFRHRRQWLLAGREALTGECPGRPAAELRTYDPALGR